MASDEFELFSSAIDKLNEFRKLEYIVRRPQAGRADERESKRSHPKHNDGSSQQNVCGGAVQKGIGFNAMTGCEGALTC